MNIVREQREQNTSLIKVTVGEQDYAQEVDKALREDKRKAAFLDKRRREAEEYAERVCGALRQELAVVREDLGKAYEFEVKRGFAPALESLFHQSVHLRLFLDVMQKIRSDVSRYDTHVQKQLEQLGGVLER